MFSHLVLPLSKHGLSIATLDIMFSAVVLFLVFELFGDAAIAHGSDGHTRSYAGLSRRASTAEIPLGESTLTINSIPYATRVHWMRQANLALPSACPFAAFGTVIVNHTDPSGPGELVCTGANSGSTSGNPTMHGRYLFDLVLGLHDPSPPPPFSFFLLPSTSLRTLCTMRLGEVD